VSHHPFASDLETALRVLRGIEDTLEREVTGTPPARGRPRDTSWHMLVAILGYVYHRATGRRPATSSIRHGDDRGGPFVRFVASFLDIVDPGNSRAGIGNHIENALQQLRDPNSSVHSTIV